MLIAMFVISLLILLAIAIVAKEEKADATAGWGIVLAVLNIIYFFINI